MATAAQLAACAANAQRSTGPRSPEGKAVSSRNAVKLGIYCAANILPGEDAAEFEQLLHDFESEYCPAGPTQTAAVQDLVRAIWLIRRYDRIETQYINLRHAGLTPEEQQLGLGAIYRKDAEGPNVLQKIERRRAAAIRESRRLTQELAPLLATTATPAPACPVKHLPPNPVRFDKPVTSPLQTPVRTSHDNWDNPALRLCNDSSTEPISHDPRLSRGAACILCSSAPLPLCFFP